MEKEMKPCEVEPGVKVRAEKIEDGFGVKSHLEGIDIAATERYFIDKVELLE